MRACGIVWVAVALGVAESIERRGAEVHCVGERAHLVHYDVEGEPSDGSSLRGVRRAGISVMPSPPHKEHCYDAKLRNTPEGDKQFCYGANQDSSCKAAKNNIPIKDGFDCKDCFVSASADAYYKLNYTISHLNSVEVGLRDINLRASVGIHTDVSKAGTGASGVVNFSSSDKPITLIDKLVGCPVCVKVTIKVAFPTSLDYSISLSGDADIEAGAVLDIDLGNNVVKYDGHKAKGSRWSHDVNSPKYSVSPLLTVDGKASADLKLDVKTSVQINVDDIVWYHLNMVPAVDSKLTFEGKNLFHNDQICLNGDPSFNMGQEADLDWKLKVWHARDHWGPSQLYSWSKPGMVHGCKEIGLRNATLLVV